MSSIPTYTTTPLSFAAPKQNAAMKALAAQVQFQGVGIGRLLTPEALQQVGVDTGNVLAPKLPFVRSKAQLFEEVFLEVVEDLAFYLTVPAVGMLLAKPVAKKLGVDAEQIGQHLGKKALQASKQLIAAKAGVLFGAIAVAAGFEYLIQHVKNVITAKQFHIKNFTAVAGLEGARTTLKEGEDDPVAKAKRRVWQTGVLTALGFAASLALPRIILKNDGALKAARHIIKYLDFDPGNRFGLSRAVLALVIGSGVASYMDASRDSLERKETATRLLFVVPGLLFGKALGNDAVAFISERLGKVDGKSVKQHLQGTGLSFTNGNPVKQGFDADSFLNFDVVLKEKDFYAKLKTLNLPEDIERGIFKKFSHISFPWSYLVSAGIFGSGVCWLAFRQTQKRFEREQAAKTPLVNNQPTFQSSQKPVVAPLKTINPWQQFQQ